MIRTLIRAQPTRAAIARFAPRKSAIRFIPGGYIVEYHSACFCDDGHSKGWGGTLDAIKGFNLEMLEVLLG